VHDADREAEVLALTRALESAVADPEVLVADPLEPEICVGDAVRAGAVEGDGGELTAGKRQELGVDGRHGADRTGRRAAAQVLRPSLTSGSSVLLLGFTQHRRVTHPGRRKDVETGLARGRQHGGVVVDQDGHRGASSQPAQHLHLDVLRRSGVAAWPEQELAVGEGVTGEPLLGVAAAVLGPTGEVDDPADLGEPLHGLAADLEQRVLRGGREEGAPVLGPAFEVVEAVADAGEDTVDVDDRDGAVGGVGGVVVGGGGVVGWVVGVPGPPTTRLTVAE